ASADSVTFNASTATLNSDLNFDSNTFVISQDDNRVGVGTASPGYPLEVNGGGYQIAARGSLGGILVQDTVGGDSLIDMTVTGGGAGWRLWNQAGAFILKDQTNDATKMFAYSGINGNMLLNYQGGGGNVGIGTNAPGSKLAVS